MLGIDSLEGPRGLVSFANFLTPIGASRQVCCSSGSNAGQSRGPKKGAVSALKALRGSKTETRELLGGMEEDSVPPIRGH